MSGRLVGGIPPGKGGVGGGPDGDDPGPDPGPELPGGAGEFPPRTRLIPPAGFSRSTITSRSVMASPVFAALSVARTRTQNFHRLSSGTSQTYRPVVAV